jgi:phosphoribosylanthranilate isomerase
MIRVKICGINSAAAMAAAVESGADWVAFNFFETSPRYVSPATAKALSSGHESGPQRVGLFVHPDDAVIAEVLAALPLDVLQIYAPAPRVAEIRARFGVPVWRAVGVTGPADLPRALEGADALLIEPKAPAGASRPGGNGQVFDWSVTSAWQPGFPWLLAGGLTPLNVAEAVRRSGAMAVDVASGVESAPGVKDAGLIRAFVAAARAA